MENEKEFKEYIKLFPFPEGKEKELQDYIVAIMTKSEKDKKTYDFDYLGKDDNLPNPCVGHDGKLCINTASMRLMFEEFKQSVKYVKTEVAQLVQLA